MAWFFAGDDAVGIGPAGHGAGGTGLQVGQQGDGLFTIPWAFNRFAAQANELAQFGRSTGSFNLEIADVLDFLGHARQEVGQERRAADWGILDQDGDADGIRQAGIELVNLLFAHADGGTGLLRALRWAQTSVPKWVVVTTAPSNCGPRKRGEDRQGIGLTR